MWYPPPAMKYNVCADCKGKHKYLMPFDDGVKSMVMELAKPYPKRVKQAMTGHPPAQRQGSTDQHAPTIQMTDASS